MKKTFLVVLLVIIGASCFASRDSLYLMPPTNLQGYNPGNTDYAHLTWNAPVDSLSGETPAGLLGYNIYRDGALVGSVDIPVTEYFDLELQMLTYSYKVTSVYDLSFYGLPEETGESASAGPVLVTLCCLPTLPFLEDFYTSSFATNQWLPDSTGYDASWNVSSQTGNLAPCACFTNSIPLTDYSRSLTSWLFSGTGLTDSTFFLFFDLKKSVVNPSATEFLYVDAFDGSDWRQVMEFTNDESSDWENWSTEISGIAEETEFKIRFRAEGTSTENILSWCIDNIHLCNRYDDCTTNIPEKAAVPVKIYPNPSSTWVTIQVPHPHSTYTICNLQGSVITTGSVSGNTTPINVSALSEGVYLIELVSATGVVNSKFVVSR